MEKPKEQLEEDIIKEAVKLFFSADKSLAGAGISRGALIRAARFAFNHGLTNKQIKLQTDQAEQKMAVVFMTLLDSWLVMKAAQHKNQTDKKEKKEGE